MSGRAAAELPYYPLTASPFRVHGFATRVHGFATKTKALARKIPPATQAIFCNNKRSWLSITRNFWCSPIEIYINKQEFMIL